MTENLKKINQFGKEITLFAQHIESLRETLPLTMMLVQRVGVEVTKELEKFEVENCEIKKEVGGKSITVEVEHVLKWKKLRKRRDKSDLAHVLVPRSIFVSLVSQYDAFFGKLLRLIFISKPELLIPSDRQFSFSQIKQFPTIDAIQEHVIEKEIESVLRTSHADQIRWAEKRFSVVLTKELNIYSDFIELTERRNLFVHADGVVSGQYLSVCKENKVNLSSELREGDKLTVPQEYFNNSCNCIYELGVKLANVLWRKLLPEERGEADTNLITVSYELIEQEEYQLSLSLLDFACESFKVFSSEWHQLALIVNQAQSYKWLGNNDKCLKILDKIDWSAKADEFKLAASVLRGEWMEAAKIMTKIGTNGAVTKHFYRDWPLFKELRVRQEFLNAYEEVFGEPFSTSFALNNGEQNADANNKQLN